MSQEKEIENYLKQGNSLTAIEALNMFRCFRLASRISDMKKHGMDIESKMIESNGKRYAQYRIADTFHLTGE